MRVFKPVIGNAFSAVCHGCHGYKTAGDIPYRSASSGVFRQPDSVFVDRNGEMYCRNCAARYAEYAESSDLARSVTVFYSDTYGEGRQ